MSYRRPGTTRRDQNDVESLHNLVMDLRDAVRDLETEKDTLRQAVRKLKIENRRTRDKVKNLCAHLKSSGLEVASDDDDFPDYDEIGRDFILIGGSHDPLDARYEATIKDADGVEYKTAERYYWAKMAAHFKDEEIRKKILDAPNTTKAEAAVMDMKNFDEKEWDKHKLQTWQDGQRLKFEQHRWITSVLVATGKVYIAVCHQDKQIGTGWRKNREESGKTLFWDGKNLGGKFLMNLRKKSSDVHEWKDGEEEEINNRLNSLKRYVWRRIDNRYQQQRYSTPIYNCRGSAPRSNYTNNNNNNNNNNGKPSRAENGSGDKTFAT